MTPSTRVVVLQNPTTLQTVECKVDPWGSYPGRQIDDCVRAYKQAGYGVAGDSWGAK